jgi:hypothetical protein
MARNHQENYSWMTGHLTDIAMVATFVAIGQAIAGKNRAIQYITALVPPTLATLHELGILTMFSDSPYYDPQDIACYWTGAVIAVGLSKVASSIPYLKRLDTAVWKLITPPDETLEHKL